MSQITRKARIQHYEIENSLIICQSGVHTLVFCLAQRSVTKETTSAYLHFFMINYLLKNEHDSDKFLLMIFYTLN